MPKRIDPLNLTATQLVRLVQAPATQFLNLINARKTSLEEQG